MNLTRNDVSRLSLHDDHRALCADCKNCPRERGRYCGPCADARDAEGADAEPPLPTSIRWTPEHAITPDAELVLADDEAFVALADAQAAEARGWLLAAGAAFGAVIGGAL